METPSLNRSITRGSAILLVISAIVGSGIFKKIAPMADALHSPTWILLCWLAAGILSLIGALCTAELAAMMPGSGGEFVFFKKIYGRFFSFIYGWGNLTVMKSATIAALAYIFSESFHSLFSVPTYSVDALGGLGHNLGVKLVATSLIIGLSFVNYKGVVFGAKLSRYLIAAIVISILGFVMASVISPEASVENFATAPTKPEGWPLVGAFFAASLAAFWGYEGWNNIGYIGEEVKNPQKNIPMALGLGTLAVIALYLLVNGAYLYVMPVEDLAAIHHQLNKIAAVEVARFISGNIGAVILSSLIMLATFTCTNSTILMSSRIVFAMARDKLFFSKIGKVHPEYKTPSSAIFWQGVWAILLLWSGNFDQLTDLLIFASFIFYGATAFGVIVMRRRHPNAERPYKVFAYPVLPIIFSLFCLTLVVVTIIERPMQALTGLSLIAAGIPFYLYFSKKNNVGPVRDDEDVYIKE